MTDKQKKIPTVKQTDIQTDKQENIVPAKHTG